MTKQELENRIIDVVNVNRALEPDELVNILFSYGEVEVRTAMWKLLDDKRLKIDLEWRLVVA